MILHLDLRIMVDIEGPLSLIAGIHIGARALLHMNMIRFGCIARRTQ
jgi:hypothetical protein